MSGAMSFEQAPPIAVPLRFFLSAPLFGCLAGLLLGLLAEQVLASCLNRTRKACARF